MSKIKIKNLELEYSYKAFKSLGSELKNFKVVPCEATILAEINLTLGKKKISVVSINNVLYVFYHQIQSLVKDNCSHNVQNIIILINSNVVDIDDVCLTSDSWLIKKNVECSAINQYYEKLYPQTVTLVATKAIEKILNYMIKNELDPYSKKLKIKKMIVNYEYGQEEQVFYSLDDFINFSKKNKTYIGKKLLRSENVLKALDPYS